MKSLTTFVLLAAFALVPHPALAQLLPDQRVFDFQSLAALYAKRYAPADWKRQALGFDMFNLKPWLDRVSAAKDDLEFFEIEAEYVAKLQDTHTGFQVPSSFTARLGAGPLSTIPGAILIGMTVDIYDGKVLIDSKNTLTLPTATYPFQVGDELVSVDGVSAADFMTRVSTWRQYGNPATTRRFASQQLVTRTQSTFPRAPEIGDRTTIQVRRASGALETYSIPWYKTGIAITNVGPVPTPRTSDLATLQPDYLQALDDLHNYKLPDNDPLRQFFVSLGSRTPHFSGGFPSSFALRLGKNTADFHYSGVYTSGGFTIGFLRIPNFSPTNTAAVITELRNEIDFLQKNTDGLIVDVTRNPGGGCYMLDVAATLIPYPFYFFGEQIRATQDRLNSFESSLESAKLTGADPSIIGSYQQYVDQMKAAIASNRGMTDPIPACRQTNSATGAGIGAPISFGNQPAATVYTKPLIVLIDELSISAADIFPSMMQDNRRVLLAGARSSGGGGSVSSWSTGFYSESAATNTNTLVVRNHPVVTPEYPAAPYVENIGARPDVPIEFMTKENLLNAGRTYVNQFTQVLVNQIKAAASEITFAISNRGGVSFTTPDSTGQPVIGYGRIQPGGGSTTPSGMAIFGLHQNNVLVTEAAVPATAAISSGRIYAEISSTVNTGIAIANPNYSPATVTFYFTGASGNFGSGTVVVPANGQIAAFLDQAPFNGVAPLIGTFTFSSPSKVAAVGLHGFTNERGEFLITTLPVTDLSVAPSGSNPVFPQFADGSGWKTEIALVNPTDAAISGALAFKDSSGNTLSMVVDGRSGTSFAYSIPPRMSQKLTTSGAGQTVQSGYVTMTPGATSVPPAGSVVFSFRPNDVTVSQTGVPSTNSSLAYRLYSEASGDFGNSAPGSIQTGVAIVNRSNTAATVNVELFRLDGSSTGLTGNLAVPAAGQVAKFLNQIPGLESMPSDFRGVVRTSSSSQISVIGLRDRYNERGDFLSTTTPPMDEAAAASDTELFFPHFVQSGGYTTQFVLFSGSSGQQSAGAVRFVSQSGEVMNLNVQ